MNAYRRRDTGDISLEPFPKSQCPPEEVETITLSGRGTVYSCTMLHAAAEPFEKRLPFQIAIIELEGGPRLTVRIQGKPVGIGDPVQQVEEKEGIWIFSAASSGS